MGSWSADVWVIDAVSPQVWAFRGMGQERFHRAPYLDLQVPLHDNGTRKMVARGVIVIDSTHRSHLHR